ncbi:MAG: hypothetical protein D6702_03165 [Planctomycetota bacterium]|nr:MAG: hypothetical protein D6702_03165 [Planctomycetota bacterium]
MRPHHLLPFLLALLPSCQTSSGPIFEEGTARSSFAGSWSKVTTSPPKGADQDTTTLETAFTAGAFATPQIETGLKGSFFDQDAGKTSLRAWDAGLYGRYWFQDRGSLRTWVEGDLGYAQGRSQGISDRNVFWGLGAGMTQFLTESTAVELGLVFDHRSFRFRGGGDTTISTLAVQIAYAIFL